MNDVKDDIKERLSSATQKCIEHYKAWDENRKDNSVRGSLTEAVHELRKAAARLEIEIAISERDERTNKPLPIPPHRSSRKNHQDQNGDKHNGGSSKGPSKLRRSSSKPKPTSNKE